MLAFQASGTGSIPVRCIIFVPGKVFISATPSATFTSSWRPSTWCVQCVVSHSFHHCSIPMRLPQLKRRRLLSNPPVPFLTPTLLVASLKPSGISTCTSCHRTIKPSPPLTCARFVVVPSALISPIHYPLALWQMQRINMRHLYPDMLRWSPARLWRDWH